MFYRLRYLRDEKNYSQSRLAAMLNMSQTGYSKYETGENDIPTAILLRLAEIYGTSTDYILGRTDVREAYPRKK